MLRGSPLIPVLRSAVIIAFALAAVALLGTATYAGLSAGQPFLALALAAMAGVSIAIAVLVRQGR